MANKEDFVVVAENLTMDNMLQYLHYKILLKSNLGDLYLLPESINNLPNLPIVSKQVDVEKTTVIFTINLDKNDMHIYNKILDNIEFTIDDLLEKLRAAHEYFNNYDISRKSQNIIDKYIATLPRYESIWNNLTTKPDYNLTLYKTRELPYFNLECKDWVKANIDALKEDYPKELHSNKEVVASKKKGGLNEHVMDVNNDQNEYSVEYEMATSKNNNFREWDVLPINKYPNMPVIVKRIETLLLLGMSRQAMMLFLRMLVSPKDCHIIKEARLWKSFNPLIENDKNLYEIFNYCCCYAMYILRQEETIMFSRVNLKYRVLFTLEEAHNLPTFRQSHMERSPHILQLTHDTRLSNCIPFYLPNGRKINDSQEFHRRFRLATAGAFRNVDLRALNAAITGSILVPCVHTSPLEKGFEDVDWVRERNNILTPFPFMTDAPESVEDFAFLNYLEYYYPSYASLNDADYLEQVLKKPTVAFDADANSIVYENDNNNTVQLAAIEADEKMTVKDRDDKSMIKVEYNQLADIDISITTRDFETFKANAYTLYEKIKANCCHRGDVYIKEIKTIASIKYKIYGPGISRPMDIFRIPYEPAKMVKKFHVHVVKMYYDNEVTMFRSCLAALVSGVNESYKWFSCNKIPIDVLLKYAQRGFSIILNSKERDATNKFISSNQRWGAMLQYLKIAVKNIYCTVTADHPFFKPGLYGSGVRLGLRNFERDSSAQYANSLVIPYPTSQFKFGVLDIKDNVKFHPPAINMITQCLDYIDTGDVIDEDI